MSTSPSPSPSPSPAPFPSSKLWLILGAATLAVLAILWLARSEDAGDDAASADAREDTRDVPTPRRPSAAPSGLDLASTVASGQVQADSGEAIAGAVVTLAPLDDNDDGDAEAQTTRTNAEGSWSLSGLRAGRYALSATAPGFLAGLIPELRLRSAQDNAGLDLRLVAGGNTLSGVVADKTGGVIEGARVKVTPQSGITRMREPESYFTLTDDQGRYAVQIPDGRHRVLASHPDYSSEAVVLELAAQAKRQDFALVPTAVIEGVVLRDSDGAPVPHAQILWFKERVTMLPTGDRMSTLDRGGELRADGAGRFRISGLPPGMIELSARSSMLASGAPLQLPVGIAERVADVELRLIAASDVSGRVLSSTDGQGIAGARVELMSPFGPGPNARADDDGAFVLVGVLPGTYQARASAEGWTQAELAPPSVEVGAAPSSVLIELERGLSIRGRVEPATQAEVSIEIDPKSLHLAGGGMLALGAAAPTRSSAEDGAFELSPVKPGTYTLMARSADGRGGSVEVEVGADGARDVVIALEQRATLAGTVTDSAGAVVSDVSVQARKRRDGASLSVVLNGRELTALSSPTTNEGRFEIAGLEAGAWIVEVVDGQGEVLAMVDQPRLELTLTKGETRELDLRVEARDGRIAGVVRDAEGEPVADAWVSAAFIAMAEMPEMPEDPEAGEAGEARSEVRMMMVSDDGAGTSRTLPPVLTDVDGKFEFVDLRRGQYTLTAELDGGRSKASLERVEPDAEVVLELAPLGAIEGKVRSNGQPAECMARIIGPTERTVRVRDGAFEAERLEPGAYRVEASSGDGSTSATVTVEAGATATVELDMERLSKLTGKVVDENGAPIAKVEILIGGAEGGRIEISKQDGDPVILTKEDGSFETKVAAGGRVLIVQAPGVPMPILIKPFTAVAGEDLDLGELRKQDMEGMMMRGGPEDEGEAPAE